VSVEKEEVQNALYMNARAERPDRATNLLSCPFLAEANAIAITSAQSPRLLLLPGPKSASTCLRSFLFLMTNSTNSGK